MSNPCDALVAALKLDDGGAAFERLWKSHARDGALRHLEAHGFSRIQHRHGMTSYSREPTQDTLGVRVRVYHGVEFDFLPRVP
jgi:hypothetical protein